MPKFGWLKPALPFSPEHLPGISRFIKSCIPPHRTSFRDCKQTPGLQGARIKTRLFSCTTERVQPAHGCMWTVHFSITLLPCFLMEQSTFSGGNTTGEMMHVPPALWKRIKPIKWKLYVMCRWSTNWIKIFKCRFHLSKLLKVLLKRFLFEVMHSFLSITILKEPEYSNVYQRGARRLQRRAGLVQNKVWRCTYNGKGKTRARCYLSLSFVEVVP